MITGVNGFVGSHLAETLCDYGFEVHGIIRSTSNTKWIDNLNINLHSCGLNDVSALSAVVEGAAYVFHLAGTTHAKKYSGYHYGNVTLTENILKACSHLDTPPQKIVLTSSIAAAGPTVKGQPLDETAPFNPVSLYGKSKAEMEELASRYMNDLPITIVRPPIVYGERDTEVFQFLKSIKSGIFPKVGGREQYINVVYVKDLAEGYVQAAESREAEGEIYFLTSNEALTWSQLAEQAANWLNKKPLTIPIPHSVLFAAGHLSGFMNRFKKRPSVFDVQKAKEGVQEAWLFSSDKARAHFNYQPKVNIEEGLDRSLQWYREQGWL